jgi:hypothetical protein
MASGVVMLLDVVATLGGGVVATLRHGATNLGAGASTVGGIVCCLVMIVVSCWMAQMCLILSAVDFGTVPPNTLRRSAAAAMGRSAEILGDPYSKISPLPSIGKFLSVCHPTYSRLLITWPTLTSAATHYTQQPP